MLGKLPRLILIGLGAILVLVIWIAIILNQNFIVTFDEPWRTLAFLGAPIFMVVGFAVLVWRLSKLVSSRRNVRITSPKRAPATTRPGEKPGEKSKEESLDPWGRGVFLFILILIPLMVAGGLIWAYMVAYNLPIQSASNEIVTVSVTEGEGPDQRTTVTTTIPMTSNLPLGVFDPSLGKMSGIAVGTIIAIIGAIMEAGLLLVYGAFYINKESNQNSPLGLPEKTVRVFVLIIVILTLILFTFLPAAWGENKAVIFLFGLLSTVVGFYYGSRKAADEREDERKAADEREDERKAEQKKKEEDQS